MKISTSLIQGRRSLDDNTESLRIELNGLEQLRCCQEQEVGVVGSKEDATYGNGTDAVDKWVFSCEKCENRGFQYTCKGGIGHC